MKKIISLTIIAIFVFSLLPFSFAENETSETKTETTAADSSGKNTETKTRATGRINADKREDIRDRRENIRDVSNIDRARCIEKCKNESGQNCEARCKVADKREDVRDRLENMREKNRERLAKIQGLDQRQIEKLSALDVKNVEKIAELKQERLERISKLSEEKLKRLAELDKEKLEKISDLNDTEIEKVSTLNRARLKELAKLDEKRLKAELKALKVVKVKTAEGLNKRNITEARLIELRERFEKAKEEFKSAKDGLNDERKKLKEAIDKGDENATLEHAKAYSLKTADALITHLEKIKAKVQESKNIPDDNEAKITAEIDAQIAEVNKIKVDIQAADTKEQIKEAAKKLHDKWKRLKHLIRLYTERVVSARVEGIVNQGLVLEKRLDNVLAKAKERGVEIDVSAEISAFSEKIGLSRGKYKQAQAKLSEALDLKAKNESANSEKIKTLTDEAKALLKSARDAIKEAHDILKTIVKKIKEADPKADISADVEIEVAQELAESVATNVTAEAST